MEDLLAYWMDHDAVWAKTAVANLSPNFSPKNFVGISHQQLWQVGFEDELGRRLDKLKEHYKGFPGGSVVKNLLAIPRDTVWSLIQEDPTCLGATKPKHHNYWACALEPGNCSYWSLSALEPMLCDKRSHGNEKPPTETRAKPVQQWRPSAEKNKQIKLPFKVHYKTQPKANAKQKAWAVRDSKAESDRCGCSPSRKMSIQQVALGRGVAWPEPSLEGRIWNMLIGWKKQNLGMLWRSSRLTLVKLEQRVACGRHWIAKLRHLIVILRRRN